jgi:hypothetical protein
LVEHRKTAGVPLPFKIAAIDDDAADRGAMAADVFRGRMQGDSGAVFNRPAQHRTSRVVHDQGHTELSADLCDLGNRKYGKLGIGQRLAIIAARPGIGSPAKVLRIGRIDKAALDAHRVQGVLEQIPGAAVDVGRADKIVAGMANVLHRK